MADNRSHGKIDALPDRLKKQVEELDKDKKITSRIIDLCVRIKNNP